MINAMKKERALVSARLRDIEMKRSSSCIFTAYIYCLNTHACPDCHCFYDSVRMQMPTFGSLIYVHFTMFQFTMHSTEDVGHETNRQGFCRRPQSDSY